MSILRAVQVGATTAQAAIDAVEQFGADANTLLLRLGVVKLLNIQQEDLNAETEEEPLLNAYRNWIDVALRYYAPDPDADLREYVQASAMLSAELRIASLRQPSPGDDGAVPTATAETLTTMPPRT
jgi:oligoendopeptidase F